MASKLVGLRRIGFMEILSVVFLVFSQAVHEFAHIFIAIWAGATRAWFEVDRDLSAFARWEELPVDREWIPDLGAGLIMGLLFLILWAVAHRTPSKYDTYLEASALGVVIIQFVYAVAEVIGWSSNVNPLMAALSHVVGLGAFILLYRAKMVVYVNLPPYGSRVGRLAKACVQVVVAPS